MSSWKTVCLGDVSSPVDRPEVITPGSKYRQIGVRLWGQGAYERETIDGADTRYGTLLRVEEGDIIVNKIWARNGSVAVVQAELAGCYGSNEFPTFAPKRDKLLPRWVHWLTKTPGFWAQCDDKSRGTSGKNRIRPERFLEVQIPLPSVPEQRRIVARIEELAAKINEARVLRINGANETEAIIRSTVTRIDNDLRRTHSVTELEDFASGERDALRSGPFGSALLHSEFVAEGVSAVGIQDVQENRFELTRRWNVTPEKAEELRRYTIKPRDILVTVMGTLGRACVVPDEVSQMVSTKHVWTITLDQKRAEPKWVSYWLNFSSLVRDELLGQGTGTAIPGLNGEKIRAVSLPEITLSEQRRIVGELDSLQARVDVLKELQAESAAELDALLPSILDKAFKGEL